MGNFPLLGGNNKNLGENSAWGRDLQIHSPVT